MHTGMYEHACNAQVGEQFLSQDDALEFAFQQALAAHTPKSGVEPRTLKEALRDPDADKWLTAACDEIVTLTSNGTWQPVELPMGAKPIGCRWMFKIKRNADGSIE